LSETSKGQEIEEEKKRAIEKQESNGKVRNKSEGELIDMEIIIFVRSSLGREQLIGVVLEEGGEGVEALVLLAATVVAVDADMLVEVVASGESLGTVGNRALKGCCYNNKKNDCWLEMEIIQKGTMALHCRRNNTTVTYVFPWCEWSERGA
jgi:hypothetical protein